MTTHPTNRHGDEFHLGSSFGSNANSVGSANAPGASSSNARMDHVHQGVHQISAAGSNALVGDVNVAAGSGIAVTVAGQSVTIAATGTTGGTTLTVEEVDGSPSVAATKLVLPNGTVSVVGTVATYTPAAGGTSGYDLDTYSLDGTYGDDFTAAALSGLWTRRNFTSGAETYQLGKNATYMRISTSGRANGDGYFQTAPGGDWTFAMAIVERGNSAIGSTLSPNIGVACIDTNGTGVAAIVYQNPLAIIVVKITTYSTYAGAFSQGTARSGSTQIPIDDSKFWLYLRKSGTSYFGGFSLDGELFSEETAALTSTHTVDRVGFMLAPLGNIPSYIDIDWFNKTA